MKPRLKRIEFKPLQGVSHRSKGEMNDRVSTLLDLVLDKGSGRVSRFRRWSKLYPNEYKIVGLARNFAHLSGQSEASLYHEIHKTDKHGPVPTREDVGACLHFLKRFKGNKLVRLVPASQESQIALDAFIRVGPTWLRSAWIRAGKIQLNFEVENNKKILYIDSIQGAQSPISVLTLKDPFPFSEDVIEYHDVKDINNDFKKMHGAPPLGFLIQKAVAAAKKAGFSEARLIKPEFNPFYYRLHFEDRERTRLEPKKELFKRQEQMRNLYYTAGKEGGFDKTKNPNFMVLDFSD